MYDLTTFRLGDMTKCSNALRKFDAGAKSMEEVANRIVRYIYDHFVDKQTGKKSCVLVRFFKTHPYGELEPKLREFAGATLNGAPELPYMKCLTLLASIGENPKWNSRKNSIGHMAIPLPSEKVVTQFPMISQLITQFGLQINTVLNPPPTLIMDLEQKTYNVFHVPDAVRTPYIPAQKEFVIPFGIKSVLGFGGMLPSGDLFVVIMFLNIHVMRETANMFKTLSLSAKVAVLPFDNGAVFSEET